MTNTDKIANITKVISRNIKGGFRYFAIFTDGTEEVLRKKATRRYQYAFAYNIEVSSGANGLAAHFSYGKKAASWVGDALTNYWVVEHEAEPATGTRGPLTMQDAIHLVNIYNLQHCSSWGHKQLRQYWVMQCDGLVDNPLEDWEEYRDVALLREADDYGLTIDEFTKRIMAFWDKHPNDFSEPATHLNDTEKELGELRDQRDRLAAEIDECEYKALDNLARYKFQNFGDWAGKWVTLNKIEGKRRPSPFGDLVKAARAITEPPIFEELPSGKIIDVSGSTGAA